MKEAVPMTYWDGFFRVDTTQGSILCQQVKSLDLKVRNATYIERLPEVLFKEVKEIIVSQL
ncbi:hypothetical protein [Sporosarcina beigongshangi]|uniref:hypothetical protein n=1 Tax=Sporosarcina beigongshangi TaxID=2782538 RepID=UPI00193A1470|nr:hypothetical protein [Sporosarcina beigongshangi]